MTLATDTKLVPDTRITEKQYTDYYQQSSQQTAENLKLDTAQGLSDKQVAERLAQYGKNELTEKSATSIWSLVYAQLAEPLVVIFCTLF